MPNSRDNRRVAYSADSIELPIVLLAALGECEVTIRDFIGRIQRGSVWQDQAIRSADRRIVIQACLHRSSLRCMVQVGDDAFYHTDTGVLDLHDVFLPATVMALADLDASAVVDDPLFRLPGVRIRRMMPFGCRDTDIGVALLLAVPTIKVFCPHVS